MKINYEKLTILSLLVLLFAGDLLAQRGSRYDNIAASRRQAIIHAEMLPLSSSESSGRAVLSFRIPHERLVFMKEAAGENASTFLAKPEILLDVFKDGKTIREETWQKEYRVETFEETKNPEKDLQGHIEVELEPGDYAYRIGIRDNRTEEASYSTGKRFKLHATNEFETGQAMYATNVEIGRDWLSADRQNIGKKILFGHEAYALISFSLAPGKSIEDVSLSYSLTEISAEQLFEMSKKRRKAMEKSMRAKRNKDDQVKLVMDYNPEEDAEGGGISEAVIGKQDIYSINSESLGEVSSKKLTLNFAKDHPNQYVALVNLEGENLQNGSYQLDLTIDDGTDTRVSKNRFDTYWRNMPLSLYDPEVAVRSLEPLIGRKAANNMAKGKRNEVIDRFREFWNERDPSPDTVFNELMSEYYARVDFAAMEYRPQGRRQRAATESVRARTYIIHGPPDNVDREFPTEGGVVETWSYSDGKVFTFRAYSSLDEYQLVGKNS